MKKLFIIIGLLALLMVQPAKAEESVWCIVTEWGTAIAMSDVACLVAADDETTFSIVLNDGNSVKGVHKATFNNQVPAGIREVSRTPIRVNSEFSLEGVDPSSPVRVFDVSGKLLLQGTAQLVKLTTLPAGIYIIQVDGTSFKIAKP